MPDGAVTKRAANRGRLVQRRKAVGLTQEQLAERLGVERTTVVRWEGGQTQPLPWLRPKLAKALGVSADRIEELLAAGPAARGAAAPGVPRQLPAAVPDFTGRAAELQTLTRMLDDADAGPRETVMISAIGGTAGVGKTALALHWAQQVAGRFGGGQLHVNLRGFGPSGTPATPEAVIRGFLDALGVPPERIPPQPEAQAGLYRSLLADRRMLIVLDNARDEQQVRPLLPGRGGSLVIVTSRNQLTGLAAVDEAKLLTVDVLTHGEAVQLLTARLGTARAADEPEAIGEIASQCACLPLALAVAAARAEARPRFPLAALAAELRDAVGRLDVLDAGEPDASVRAVFSWSYRQLTADAARMFRLLGLHPGPDISVPAAASLAATSKPQARRLLRGLTRGQLLSEHVPGRYALHDLLRAYGADQARTADSEAERTAAVGRVLDHYLHTARAAALLLLPSHEPVALAAPGPDVIPEQVTEYQQAMAWFEVEHHVLLAAVTFAAEAGFDGHAWQLPWAMMPFLALRGRYAEYGFTQRTALDAAARLGHIGGRATASRLLANAHSDSGDYDQALGYYANGLKLYEQLGDRLGEAKLRQNLAVLADRQRRYADALSHAEHALRLYQAVGHKAGEVEGLNAVGWYYGLLGDYQQSRAFCRRALILNAEVGHRTIEADIWDSLGYAEHHLRNFSEAAACYEHALGFAREVGDRPSEAAIFTHLGDARHSADKPAQARAAWRQALAIFEDLQHPDADDVRAKLASTKRPRPSEPGRVGMRRSYSRASPLGRSYHS